MDFSRRLARSAGSSRAPAVGVGWLLTAAGVDRGIDWLWILGLGVTGILTFALDVLLLVARLPAIPMPR